MPSRCTPDGLQAAAGGKALAGVSTASFAVGAAGIGAGVILLLVGREKAPPPRTAVSPLVLPGGGGVVAVEPSERAADRSGSPGAKRRSRLRGRLKDDGQIHLQAPLASRAAGFASALLARVLVGIPARVNSRYRFPCHRAGARRGDRPGRPPRRPRPPRLRPRRRPRRGRPPRPPRPPRRPRRASPGRSRYEGWPAGDSRVISSTSGRGVARLKRFRMTPPRALGVAAGSYAVGARGTAMASSARRPARTGSADRDAGGRSARDVPWCTAWTLRSAA